MKTPNLSSAFYAPGVAPSEPDQLRRFFEDELRKILDIETTGLW